MPAAKPNGHAAEQSAPAPRIPPRPNRAGPKKNQTSGERSLFGHALGLLEKQLALSLEKSKAYFSSPSPEALHGLRVALRRLRTLVLAFGDALELPAQTERDSIRSISRTLGSLRDSDILQERIQRLAKGVESQDEKNRIRELLAWLKETTKPGAHTEGGAEGGNVETALGEALLDLGRNLRKEAETRPSLSHLPLGQTFPHVMNRFIADFYLHGGWTLANPDENPKTLHSLRKKGKRLRYILEFHSSILSRGAHVRGVLRRLEKMQDILGKLQDYEVVKEYLGEAPEGARSYPQLSRELQTRRRKVWEKWQDLRNEFLDDAMSTRVRRLADSGAPKKIDGH